MEIPLFTNSEQSKGVPPGSVGKGWAKRFWNTVMRLRGVVAAMTLVSFLVEFGGVEKVKALEAIRAFSLLWHETFVWFSYLIENVLRYFSIDYRIDPFDIKILTICFIYMTPLFFRGDKIEGKYYIIIENIIKKLILFVIISLLILIALIIIDIDFTIKISINIMLYYIFLVFIFHFFLFLFNLSNNKQLAFGYLDVLFFFFFIEGLYFAEMTSFNEWIDDILESRQAAIAQEGGL